MIKDSDIRKANTWWKSAKSIEKDDKIEEWKNSKIKYDSRLRHKIRFDYPANNSVFYTLRPKASWKDNSNKITNSRFSKKRC